jgi:hypothetical protein
MNFRRDVTTTKKKHALLAAFWDAMLTRHTERSPANKLNASVIALPDRFFATTDTLLPFVFFAKSIVGCIGLAFACPSTIPATGNNGLFRSTHSCVSFWLNVSVRARKTQAFVGPNLLTSCGLV